MAQRGALPKPIHHFHFHAGEFQCDWVSGDNQLCTKVTDRKTRVKSVVRRQHVIILLIHRVLTIGGRMCNPEFAIRKATKTQKSHMGDQTQCLFLRGYQATPTDGCAVSPRLEVQRFISNGREEVVGQGILKEIKEHRLHIQHITSWVYFNLFCICCEPSTGSTNGCCDSFCTAVHPSDLYDVVRTGISHKAKSPRESYRYKSPIVAIITDIAIILQKLCEWRRKLWCNICSFFFPSVTWFRRNST